MGSKQDRYTDEEIIAGIRAGGRRMESILNYVYKRYWPMVKDYVRKQNGSTEEAEEVYQEGMVGFYENIIQGKYQHRNSISPYLFSICKFTWHKTFSKRRRKDKVEFPLEDFDKPDEGFLGRLIEKDEFDHALHLLEKLGESCKQILLYIHYFNYSMKEVAKMMGYKNDQIARNKHYKCNKSLEKLVGGNSR